MNCTEVAQRLMRHPRDPSAPLVAHRTACPSCDRLARFLGHLAEVGQKARREDWPAHRTQSVRRLARERLLRAPSLGHTWPSSPTRTAAWALPVLGVAALLLVFLGRRGPEKPQPVPDTTVAQGVALDHRIRHLLADLEFSLSEFQARHALPPDGLLQPDAEMLAWELDRCVHRLGKELAFLALVAPGGGKALREQQE